MNIAKRNRLKAKRTPWAKTRSGRRAHAVANVIRAMTVAHGLAQINMIGSASTVGGQFDNLAKTMAMAGMVVSAFSAAAKIPVRGSKAV